MSVNARKVYCTRAGHLFHVCFLRAVSKLMLFDSCPSSCTVLEGKPNPTLSGFSGFYSYDSARMSLEEIHLRHGILAYPYT